MHRRRVMNHGLKTIFVSYGEGITFPPAFSRKFHNFGGDITSPCILSTFKVLQEFLKAVTRKRKTLE